MTSSAWAVLRGVLVVLIALALALPVAAPVVSGHRFIVVDGGSMSPTVKSGDVLVTTAPTGHDLEVGRILIVGTPGTLYAHRVIKVDRATAPEGGEPRARLQGDANATPDPSWVTQGDVYAVYLTHLGGATAWVVRAATTLPGTVILLAVAVLLLLTGTGTEARRRARRSQHSPPPPSPPATPGP